MSRPAIIINELDAERLDMLLEQPAFAGLPVAQALNDELDRAQMCRPESLPADVVSMNSQVKFRDLTSGEVYLRTLAYPAQVTDSTSQLSVMAPVGAALLGLRVATPSTGRCRTAAKPILRCLSCSTSLKRRASTTAKPVQRMPRILFPFLSSVYDAARPLANPQRFCF